MGQMLNAEFGCRKCGKAVSFNQYKLNRFCPDCGTLLRPVRYWIFQFNPEIYEWFNWIKENRETEQWLASQHAREIREGDRVVIWASGGKAGVYAMGEIMANLSKRPLNPAQEKYWKRKEDIRKFLEKNSVIIKYLKVIVAKPLLEDECSNDPILSSMEILKQSQGTNFPLTMGQWKRILELVEKTQ